MTWGFSAVLLALALPAAALDGPRPAWLPPGYSYQGAEELPRKAASILHMRFSDGTKALSLFQCPRGTRLSLGGRAARRLKLASGAARLAETSQGLALAWSRDGTRYVLVGELPEADLRRVAESLP